MEIYTPMLRCPSAVSTAQPSGPFDSISLLFGRGGFPGLMLKHACLILCAWGHPVTVHEPSKLSIMGAMSPSQRWRSKLETFQIMGFLQTVSLNSSWLGSIFQVSRALKFGCGACRRSTGEIACGTWPRCIPLSLLGQPWTMKLYDTSYYKRARWSFFMLDWPTTPDNNPALKGGEVLLQGLYHVGQTLERLVNWHGILPEWSQFFFFFFFFF